jgi:hypothetical protein
MATSNPGLMGAFGGLALGVAQYVIAMGVARRLLTREIEEGGDMPGMGFVAKRFRSMRNALAGFSFLVMPALGFALGSAFGSHDGGMR